MAFDGITASSPAPAGIGPLLARWRRTRRLSQLGLALEAEISSRHLSFIETGRSRPSRDMVLRLARALEVPERARNDLLLAAGFAPQRRETPLDAPEMAPMLEALRLILARHEPFGALALDRHHDIVMAGPTHAALIGACAAAPGPVAPLALIPEPRPNLLRLLCRPDGLRPLLANWAEIVGATLLRAEREAARAPGPRWAALLAELTALPDVAAARALAAAETAAPLVIPVLLRDPAGGGTVSLLSTIATLGTAEDITLRELHIEAFYPANAAAEFWGRRRACGAG